MATQCDREGHTRPPMLISLYPWHGQRGRISPSGQHKDTKRLVQVTQQHISFYSLLSQHSHYRRQYYGLIAPALNVSSQNLVKTVALAYNKYAEWPALIHTILLLKCSQGDRAPIDGILFIMRAI